MINTIVSGKEMVIIKLFRLSLMLVCCASISACALPTRQEQIKQGSLQTAVVDSLVGTQAAGTLTAIIPTPTVTPLPPTPVPDTPTPSLTPRPSLTATMEGVWLTVQKDANCLSGPGSGYETLLLVKSGTMVEVMALEKWNSYYYIRDPGNFSQYCWIPVDSSPVTGNVARLPVITAQPLPAPEITVTGTPAIGDFSVSFENVVNCKDSYGIVLYVQNTGRIIWRSVRVILTDNTTRQSFIHDSNLFRGTTTDPCSLDMENAQDDLVNGEGSLVACVNSGQFKYNPTGHDFSVRITLYSQDGRTGKSVDKVITFKP